MVRFSVTNLNEVLLILRIFNITQDLSQEN